VRDVILSPDGVSMWTGTEWIPVPPPLEDSISVQDSVIMGDINKQTTVYVSNKKGSIENYLQLMLESYENGEFKKGENYLAEAKEININDTINLYNSKFRHRITEIKCMNLLICVESSKPVNHPGGAGLPNNFFVQHWTIVHDRYLEIKRDGEIELQIKALGLLLNWLEAWYFMAHRLSQFKKPIFDYLLDEYISVDQKISGQRLISESKVNIKESIAGHNGLFFIIIIFVIVAFFVLIS
jgi:hypothetical protein